MAPPYFGLGFLDSMPTISELYFRKNHSHRLSGIFIEGLESAKVGLGLYSEVEVVDQEKEESKRIKGNNVADNK